MKRLTVIINRLYLRISRSHENVFYAENVERLFDFEKMGEIKFSKIGRCKCCSALIKNAFWKKRFMDNRTYM